MYFSYFRFAVSCDFSFCFAFSTVGLGLAREGRKVAMRHKCFPAALRSPEAYCAHPSMKLTMEIRAGTNVVNLILDTSRNNSR